MNKCKNCKYSQLSFLDFKYECYFNTFKPVEFDEVSPTNCQFYKKKTNQDKMWNCLILIMGILLVIMLILLTSLVVSI